MFGEPALRRFVAHAQAQPEATQAQTISMGKVVLEIFMWDRAHDVAAIDG
jgi:hypothetical protein